MCNIYPLVWMALWMLIDLVLDSPLNRFLTMEYGCRGRSLALNFYRFASPTICGFIHLNHLFVLFDCLNDSVTNKLHK